MDEDKEIGLYLGDGRVLLNENGIKMIVEEIKENEIISEEELLKRVNRKIKRINGRR